MNNIVYVIGAGASKEVKLPTGYELKNTISNLLDLKWDFRTQTSGDELISEALNNFVDPNNGITEYINAAWHIRDALPQAISIDNFIDAHKGNNALLCVKS